MMPPDDLSTALADILQAYLADGTWRVVTIGSAKSWPTLREDIKGLALPVIVLLDASPKPAPEQGGV